MPERQPRRIETHRFLPNPRKVDSCQFLVTMGYPQDEECGGKRAEHVEATE